MLRVAVDVHTIGAQATGNETYASGLLRAYMAQPPGDLELFFYHTGGLDPLPPPWRTRRLRPASPLVRIPLVTPWRLLRDRIDVAHFQYLAPPLCPGRLVITVHDLSFERHPEFFPRAMAARMRWLMPRMVRLARRIIVVSEATRDDVVSLYGVDPARIRVVYNGLPATIGPLEDREHAARVLARFALKRPFILCVGNLGARKNQVRLLRAFARLPRESGHDLVLAGKATHGAGDVARAVDELGLASRVHVTGFVSGEELRALYGLATFTVYPSLYEGFGLPVLESMGCGTAVITSDVTSMPEIAGDAALLADPRDEDSILRAMDRLLADDALRARLGAAGRARAGAFTWARAARDTLQVYREAAA